MVSLKRPEVVSLSAVSTQHIVTRIIWIASYTLFYIYFATEWWMFLFLPLTYTMGAFQGAGINWWAHKFGYRNYELGNTSTNIIPVDILFWGESYHNNHHKFPARTNNAIRWFEIDFGYWAMRALHQFGIIKLKKNS